MPRTKSRTISYLRSRWPVSLAITLQDAIRSALDALSTASQTRLSIGDGAAQVSHRLVQPSHVCLHIATWTDGEETSIVPHETNNVEEDLAIQPPGQAWDYLNGDGMFLVSNNHCLIMPSGLLPKTIENYLRQLIDHARQQGASIPPATDRFELLPIANEQVMRQIRREGVKKLRLNIGQYHETATVGIENDQPRRRLSDMGQILWENLAAKDDHRGLIRQASNVTARLEISLDRRRKGLVPEQLTEVVEEIVADAEDKHDVQIETGSGQLIRRGRLVLKKAVEVQAFAKTIHHERAWHEMIEYFQELSRRGALDE